MGARRIRFVHVEALQPFTVWPEEFIRDGGEIAVEQNVGISEMAGAFDDIGEQRGKQLIEGFLAKTSSAFRCWVIMAGSGIAAYEGSDEINCPHARKTSPTERDSRHSCVPVRQGNSPSR